MVQLAALLVGKIKLKEVNALLASLESYYVYGCDLSYINIAFLVNEYGITKTLTGKEYRYLNHVTRNNLKLQRYPQPPLAAAAAGRRGSNHPLLPAKQVQKTKTVKPQWLTLSGYTCTVSGFDVAVVVPLWSHVN